MFINQFSIKTFSRLQPLFGLLFRDLYQFKLKGTPIENP